MANSRLFNIVVLGAMNPRIHHPYFYELVGLVSAEEAKKAAEQNVIVTPPVSQFQCTDFAISCQEERWEIQTTNEESQDRICEITWKLYDELLKYTPVRLLGYNFIYLFDIDNVNIGTALAENIVSLPFGIGGGKYSYAEFVIRESCPGKSIKMSVRPSNDANQVHIFFNYEYTPPQDKMFELRAMIEGNYDMDSKHSLESANMMLSAFRQLKARS